MFWQKNCSFEMLWKKNCSFKCFGKRTVLLPKHFKRTVLFLKHFKRTVPWKKRTVPSKKRIVPSKKKPVLFRNFAKISKKEQFFLAERTVLSAKRTVLLKRVHYIEQYNQNTKRTVLLDSCTWARYTY